MGPFLVLVSLCTFGASDNMLKAFGQGHDALRFAVREDGDGVDETAVEGEFKLKSQGLWKGDERERERGGGEREERREREKREREGENMGEREEGEWESASHTAGKRESTLYHITY